VLLRGSRRRNAASLIAEERRLADFVDIGKGHSSSRRLGHALFETERNVEALKESTIPPFRLMC